MARTDVIVLGDSWHLDCAPSSSLPWWIAISPASGPLSLLSKFFIVPTLSAMALVATSRDAVGALVSSHNARHSVRVVWQGVATPANVQIRSDKKVVDVIRAPRSFAINIERRERRPDGAEGRP